MTDRPVMTASLLKRLQSPHQHVGGCLRCESAGLIKAKDSRITVLEAAIERHEKWDRYLNANELPVYQPLPHHTELWGSCDD